MSGLQAGDPALVEGDRAGRPDGQNDPPGFGLSKANPRRRCPSASSLTTFSSSEGASAADAPADEAAFDRVSASGGENSPARTSRGSATDRTAARYHHPVRPTASSTTTSAMIQRRLCGHRARALRLGHAGRRSIGDAMRVALQGRPNLTVHGRAVLRLHQHRTSTHQFRPILRRRAGRGRLH